MSDSTSDVTLVIPARDAARTLANCLEAVATIRDRAGSRLGRIILVDDGSVDSTRDIAANFGVDVLRTDGGGAGLARNAGIEAADTELVWFVDADCVAAPDALDRLLPHLVDPEVAGVGGTYDIAPEATLLERLIHEEIKVRHDAMPEEVDFLATFDVLYRRSVLVSLGGFDVRYLKGQDADLAFRAVEAGHRLRFERRSSVRHYHADRLSKYLRVQRQQGYWRVALHLEHPGRGGRNAYSGWVDHVQPFVAAAIVVGTPVVLLPWGWLLWASLWCLLMVLQLPMATRMVRRAGIAMLAFIPLGTVRSLWRAVGLMHGTINRIRRRDRRVEGRVGTS